MPYHMEKKSGNADSRKSNAWMGDWYEYCVDSMQRCVMFMDTLRIKGNNYLDTIRKGEPPVLAFDYEVIVQTNKKKTRKEEYKMRRHLIIILLAIVGLFLGTNGFSQEKKGPGVGDIADKTAEGQQINAFMVEKIIGSKVINMKGETLGKIENLVVDIDTGRIVYAVLESGGFLGIGDKLFPVPWKSLAALPSEGIFFLDQSKEQMEKAAPAFDKNNLPNMADMRWGANVFKYYGAPSGYAQWGPPDDYGYEDYSATNYPLSRFRDKSYFRNRRSLQKNL